MIRGTTDLTSKFVVWTFKQCDEVSLCRLRGRKQVLFCREEKRSSRLFIFILKGKSIARRDCLVSVFFFSGEVHLYRVPHIIWSRYWNMRIGTRIIFFWMGLYTIILVYWSMTGRREERWSIPSNILRYAGRFQRIAWVVYSDYIAAH